MNLIDDISKFNNMVLATSMEDKVTARTVSTIIYNNKIYFQTANTMEKYKQLSKNSNVAMTKGFYQIIGVAKSIGTWIENEKICAIYKKHHQNSYESYGHLSQEEVIEVEIHKIKLWSYENDGVYIIEYNNLTNTINKIKQSSTS